MSWDSLAEGNYEDLVHFYSMAIESSPENITNYWYLGLAYLLHRKPEEANSIWLSVFAQGSETDIELWNQELIAILEQEAQRQYEKENYYLSWLIRCQIKEIEPNLFENLLKLIVLECILGIFHPQIIKEWQIIELLQKKPPRTIDNDLLLKVLIKSLDFPSDESISLAENILLFQVKPEYLDFFIQNIVISANNILNGKNIPIFSIELIKLCIKIEPHRISLLKQLFAYYAIIRYFNEALEVAEKYYEKAESLTEKIFGNYQLLYVYMLRTDWLKVKPIAQRHKDLIKELVQSKIETIESYLIDSFAFATQPLLYFEDNPVENRFLLNYISQILQYNTKSTISIPIIPLIKKSNKKLKIGYIGHTLRTHSVGWLSRWLFHYHNREAFEIAIYMVNQPEDRLTEEWFKTKVDIARSCEANTKAIAEQIQKDEIDILVDLDSLTQNITCQVMALKPAPVQVTWLGLDASGIPAIDYFIADSYVLPDSAQSYYQEKIWRLPQTYLAVDGFEVGIPTLRRTELDIPQNAVIYFNVQGSLKRHPDTIRLQMKIISAVENSYFLLKGRADEEITKELYTTIAKAEGVSPSRLRFLPYDKNEETHRANLAIADVVLDTYPYNGATTTLEVLWMGIPIVTRVGEQFAARNSYAFMTNAGLTEGIAWTDEEYVEWGIRFGSDEKLRQLVSSKLKASRQTSPLWKAKEFTQEMERAYQQMWAIYQEGIS